MLGIGYPAGSVKLTCRGEVINPTGGHDRRANLIRAYLVHAIEPQHRASPPIGLRRLIRDCSTDEVELFRAKPSNKIIDIGNRYRIVFDRDDRVIFRSQLTEIVKRIIGVVPKESALLDMGKTDPH